MSLCLSSSHYLTTFLFLLFFFLLFIFLYLSTTVCPPTVFHTTPHPLRHSLAGYNNLEVAEYLLEHGADVNAQDKGGLIPLHNAASYGV